MSAVPIGDVGAALPSPVGRSFWRRFLAHRSAVIGGVIVVIVVALAIFAPLLAPYSYSQTDLLNTWAKPDAEHLFGTDELGRDVLSRFIYGARTSLAVGITVMAITVSFGVVLGMAAGYLGGAVDALIMRTVDLVLAFPEMVFAILVAAAIGPGTLTVIVALSLVWWPGIARLARSLVLVLRSELFVDAAIVSGTPPAAILWRHFLPNMAAPLLVRASVGIGFIIMAEAALSFLGLGIQEPVPSWGGLIRDGLTALHTDPLQAVAGSAILGVSIIGFNLLGDGLRDILDPRLKAQ